jgi:aromatic ring-opening dioxygenase catalytic subunit (LigB family)
MEQLYRYPDLEGDARLSLPGLDHFWPLLYALAARDGDPVQFVSDFIQYKSLSMTSAVFGGAAV